jgi:hypothetical protein
MAKRCGLCLLMVMLFLQACGLGQSISSNQFVALQLNGLSSTQDCRLDQGLAPKIASYCYDVQLLPQQKQVLGHGKIVYHNASADTLDTLWMHLYLRAFSSQDTVWMRESGGSHRGEVSDAEALGDIELHALRLADGTDLLASAEINDTRLSVALPQPLQAGDTLELSVEWTSTLPRVFARTGYGGKKDDFFMVGQWYPKMAVYDRGEWDTEPWHTNAEFFHDFGSYDLTITAPQDYIIAATGVPEGEPFDTNKLRSWRFRAQDVTDFAFAASPTFQTVSEQVGSTEVILYYLPEHSRYVEEYMTSATGSLQHFNQWFGEYPHARISVIDVPNDASGAGGMEYPMLITGGTYGTQPEDGYVALVTAHEMAHQWWPMQTATHEGREPWLDEGLTEYSGMRYLAEVNDTISLNLDGRPLSAEETLRTDYDTAILPATKPSWEYDDYDYAMAAYYRPAIGLWTLEKTVGSEAFFAAMASYLKEYRFKHPTTQEFRQVMERELGDLSWFFDDFMEQGQSIDYVVRSIRTDGKGTSVILRRNGEVRVPIDVWFGFADGSYLREVWTGKSQYLALQFPADKPVIRVWLDPLQKLVGEINRRNNVSTTMISEDTG